MAQRQSRPSLALISYSERSGRSPLSEHTREEDFSPTIDNTLRAKRGNVVAERAYTIKTNLFVNKLLFIIMGYGLIVISVVINSCILLPGDLIHPLYSF